MKRFPKIICLCGSTRFYAEYVKANFDETMNGNIVLTCGVFNNSEIKLYDRIITVEDKVMLDKLHKKKINICDEILVLNVGGYIGESTRNEIKYAEHRGKKVRYLIKI